MKERFHVNFGYEPEYISLLKYFDALSPSFYEIFFTEVIKDDGKFSEPEIQTAFFDVCTKPSIFKRYNAIALPNTLNQIDYTTHGVFISFILGDGVVKYFRIRNSNATYERRHVDHQDNSGVVIREAEYFTEREDFYLHIFGHYGSVPLLRYFDALSPSFYHDFFKYFVQDDTKFSDPDVQELMVEVFTKSTVFKMYNQVPAANNRYDYHSQGVTITYQLEETTIPYLKIEVDGETYERKLNETR